MTLSDLAAIGSIVSSLAVALSLIYLGVQTHQAAKHTRALISQGRSSRQTDHLAAFSETDRVVAFLEITTGTSPTPELVKQMQARMFFLAGISGWFDVFEQFRQGLLSDDQLADMRASVSVLLHSLPARQIWEQWKAGRPNTHAAFKAWMDDAISASPPPGAA
jgi:hypothetical protein